MRENRMKQAIIASIFLLTLVRDNSSGVDQLQFGITLDCARRYHTVAEIKKYIDVLATTENSFFQLHLTDNENAGIESSFLAQTTASAIRHADGSYENPVTGKKFLSKEQINSILEYAAIKNVSIVPEIDLPAHARGFLELAAILHGESYVNSIASDFEEGELDISKEEAVQFALQIYAEYTSLFHNCNYFHIGCDELFFSTSEDIQAYINRITSFVMEKGFTVRLWNDLLTKENIHNIPQELEVTYWSFDGDTEDLVERELRRKTRASVPDLQNAGFNVLIYNSYYLYYVPSLANYTPQELEYMENDLRDNWNPGKWDSENGETLPTTEHIRGAAISIWNEDSAGLAKEKIYDEGKKLYDILKTKAPHANQQAPLSP